MKNKIITVLLSVVFSSFLVLSFSKTDGCIPVEEVVKTEEVIKKGIEESNETILVQKKMEKILQIIDKKEKLLAFKKIKREHSGIFEKDETIEDYFTESELNLLYMVVEAEITEGDFDSKVNIANVVLNRYYDGRFGESLIDILNKEQFESVSNKRYKKVKVTEDTKLACEYAFIFEDTTFGSLYFEMLNTNVHHKYADYLFSDGYHKFYK